MVQKSLKVNIILNYIKTFFSLLFPLITFPYVSRILGPVNIGKVTFSQSIVSYFGIIAALGIGTYGVREVSKVKDNQQELDKLSKEIFTINCVSTAIAYILLIGVIFFFKPLFPYRKLIFICSATILFTTLGMDWIYTAEEDFLYITIRTIAVYVLSLVMLFTFVKNQNDYAKYAGISVVANVGSNVFNFIHSRKYINLRIKCNLEIKKHLRPLFVLVSLALANSVYTILDNSMVGIISGDYQVGIYSAATKINKIVLSTIITLGGVLLPRMSYYVANNKEEEYNILIYKAFDLLFYIAMPCTIGLFLVSKPLVLLLCGSEYSEAVPVMRIMNFLILIVTLGNSVQTQIFLPRNLEKYNFYAIILGAVTNFILNLLLIPRFDAMGAAIGSVCAEFSVAIFSTFIASRYINQFKLILMIVKYMGMSLFMGIPVILIQYYMQNMVNKLLFGILSGGIFYFVISLIIDTPVNRLLLKGKGEKK